MISTAQSDSVDSAWTIVVDCGSTGSRLHLFERQRALQASYGPVEPIYPEIEDSLNSLTIGKVKPGLSAFVHEPASALKSIESLLLKASAIIADKGGANQHAAVLIRGTAGMRTLTVEQRVQLYTQMTADFEKLELPISAEVSFATISGQEEAYFGLVAINYLTQTVGLSLEAFGTPLRGTLDLGGSSMQIALPRPGMSLRVEAADVRSYAGMGLQAMLKRNAVFTDQWGTPCQFPGEQSTEGEPLIYGDAVLCRHRIRSWVNLLIQNSDTNLPPLDDMFGLGRSPPVVAVSTYYHAVRCMAVLTKNSTLASTFPVPSLKQLKQTARQFCQQSWRSLEAAAAELKATSRVWADLKPTRCFEVNYVVVLFEQMGLGGFRESEVLFADQLQNQSVDWPLGLYLDAEVHGLQGQQEVSLLRGVLHLSLGMLVISLMVISTSPRAQSLLRFAWRRAMSGRICEE